MTNNPEKVEGLIRFGMKVSERVPLEIPATEHDRGYLTTKRDLFGHKLSLDRGG